MADIVLAQLEWNTWMVKGEDLLDDLLINSLPADVTIEFITCESESEVHEMWSASVRDPVAAGPAWMIHPTIVERTRRMMGFGGTFAVVFAAWSAALDANAETTLGHAVEAAVADAAAKVVVTSYVADDAPPFAGELANIRVGMVEKDLVARGVAEERISRERLAPGADEAEKADQIVISVSKT